MEMFDTSDWVVGISGIVLFISTFFSFFGYGTLWILLGLAAVALVCIENFGNVEYPFQIGYAYIAIGGLAALLGLIRLIQILSWGLVHYSLTTHYIAMVLGILGGAGILVGGIMRTREGY